MTDTNTQPEAGAVSRLQGRLDRGREISKIPDFSLGQVRMWTASVRGPLREIFGHDSPVFTDWPSLAGPLHQDDPRQLLQTRLLRLDALISRIREGERTGFVPGHRVFIGHGRSLVWRELKDFLSERLGLPWEEFNRESAAGVATTDRLAQMVGSACFAFLVMTAEDEHADSSLHARENVVHEVGLFQGKLGLRKAIVLVEEGCATFSNIHGLSYISFPHGRVGAAFEEIRRVLERERIVVA